MTEKNIAGAELGSSRRRQSRRGITCLSALTICCLAAVEAKATLVTVTSSNLSVSISDSTLGTALPSVADNTNPFSTVHIVSGAPVVFGYQSKATTSYNLDEELRTDYELKYPDTAGSGLLSLMKGAGTVNFTANVNNIRYSLGAGASNTGFNDGSSFSNYRLSFTFTDVTNNSIIYTAIQTLTNNVAGGSDSGVPFGDLVAGNSYRFESSFEGSNNNLLGLGSITSPGNAQVSFRVIPEPSGLAFLGLAALGLIRRR